MLQFWVLWVTRPEGGFGVRGSLGEVLGGESQSRLGFLFATGPGRVGSLLWIPCLAGIVLLSARWCCWDPGASSASVGRGFCLLFGVSL